MFRAKKISKIRRALFIVLAYVAVLVVPIFFRAHANACQPLKVVIRYDDYTKNSPIAVEKELFAGIEALRMRMMVGVVPFAGDTLPARGAPSSLPKSKLEILAEYASRGVIEVSLHGFRHVDQALPGVKSEFAGVPESLQTEWLRRGKDALEAALGKTIRVFVPPWNRHDAQTVAALAASGFVLLSSADAEPAVEDSPVRYLPGTVYPQEFSHVVKRLREDGQCEGVVTIVAHPYDFTGRAELPSFRKGGTIAPQEFLGQLEELYEAGMISVVGIEDLIRRKEELGYRRFRLNQALRYGLIERFRLLPARLGLSPSRGIYYEQEEAAKLLLMRRLLASSLYGLVLLAAFNCALWALRKRAISYLGAFASAAFVTIIVMSVSPIGSGGAAIPLLATLNGGVLLGVLWARNGSREKGGGLGDSK